MMGHPLILEDFDHSPSPRPVDSAASLQGGGTEGDIEDVRLQAYEKGYGAGWEDASSALKQEQETIATDFARHLQELSFTYHEAHAAVQKEISEIVIGLVEKVFAPAARDALGQLISGRVSEIVSQAQVPVEIVIAPQNTSLVEALVAQTHGPPMRIVAEATLGEGQAFLRFGKTEEKIDLDTVLDEVSDAVGRYFEDRTSEEEPSVGKIEVRHG